MARKIEVDLTTDTSDFEAGMKSAAASTDKLERSLKSADSATSKFDDGLGKVNDGLGSSTEKFRSTADLAGGLGDVLGIQAAGPLAMYATGFADIADGLGGLLAPALAKAKAAFMAMNATLLANPIFLVVAALAALTIGFVVAYKKSETFRNIVNKVFGSVKDAAGDFLGFVKNAVAGAAKVIGRVADIITTPYRIAFKAIAAMWNATLGGFGISIPGFSIPFGPSFGGLSFTIPDIPTFRATGGPLNANQAAIVGERGPELFVPSGAGTVVPNGQLGSSKVELVVSGDAALVELIRRVVRVRGGNVQAVFGA
jgi:phage-related protein